MWALGCSLRHAIRPSGMNSLQQQAKFDAFLQMALR
jgi:hypothetical protein